MSTPGKPTRAEIEAYELYMMRLGPYWDKPTHTLRVPHRWNIADAARKFEELKFKYDNQRKEYWRDRIFDEHADEQVIKCREYFFKIYKVFDQRVTPLR